MKTTNLKIKEVNLCRESSELTKANVACCLSPLQATLAATSMTIKFILIHNRCYKCVHVPVSVIGCDVSNAAQGTNSKYRDKSFDEGHLQLPPILSVL